MTIGYQDCGAAGGSLGCYLLIARRHLTNTRPGSSVTTKWGDAIDIGRKIGPELWSSALGRQ
jgi:hypothetical protein